MMKFTANAETDVGQRRSHNEDCVLCRPEMGLYVVCDGMGGHAAGEVASALASRVVEDELIPQIKTLRALMDGGRRDRKKAQQAVQQAIRKANYEVYSASERDPARRGMGTTLTLLLVHDGCAIVGQVGDSRMYLVREGQTHQVTSDHTLLNDMVRAGRIDPNDREGAEKLGALTRAVGVHADVDVDTVELDLLPGDVMMVCSDGLHGYLDMLDVANFFAHTGTSTAAENLVEFANKNGGHDNISVITVHAHDAEATAEQLRARLTLDTLKRIPLFHYLNFSELLKLIPVSQALDVEKGDRLIEHDTPGSDLFIVLEGAVEVHKGDTSIARLGPGRYFGEMSLVDSRPRSASVTALEQSHLIQISRDDFYQLLREDSVLAVKLLWNFIQSLSSMVRVQNKTLGEEPILQDALAHPYKTDRTIDGGDDA